MVRKYFVFYGRVQGVGFRYTAMNFADQLGLTGWVKNDWDGSVRMEVQGVPAGIDRMIEKLGRARFIRIERYTERPIPVVPDETGFKLR